MKLAACFRLGSVLLGAASLAAVLTGCASYRIMSTLEPSKMPIPAPAGVKFTLAEVTYLAPTNMPDSGFAPFGILFISDGTLRTNLMAAAVAAYPGTFSDKPGSSPLKVAITHADNQTDMNAPYTCVSCLTLTILPTYSVDRNDYQVAVTSGKEKADVILSRPLTFTRADAGWISILPTGWIPVPASQGARAWGVDSAAKKVGTATLNGTVEAIALRLRQVDPELWR
jgi:hypothetical protein